MRALPLHAKPFDGVSGPSLVCGPCATCVGRRIKVRMSSYPPRASRVVVHGWPKPGAPGFYNGNVSMLERSTMFCFRLPCGCCMAGKTPATQTSIVKMRSRGMCIDCPPSQENLALAEVATAPSPLAYSSGPPPPVVIEPPLQEPALLVAPAFLATAANRVATAELPPLPKVETSDAAAGVRGHPDPDEPIHRAAEDSDNSDDAELPLNSRPLTGSARVLTLPEPAAAQATAIDGAETAAKQAVATEAAEAAAEVEAAEPEAAAEDSNEVDVEVEWDTIPLPAAGAVLQAKKQAALDTAATEGLLLERSKKSSSGFKGARACNHKFIAEPYTAGRKCRLGAFDTAEEAALAVARHRKVERVSLAKEAVPRALTAQQADEPALTAQQAKTAAVREGLTLELSSESSTGFKGVEHGRFEARRTVGDRRRLGLFNTTEEAAHAVARDDEEDTGAALSVAAPPAVCAAWLGRRRRPGYSGSRTERSHTNKSRHRLAPSPSLLRSQQPKVVRGRRDAQRVATR